MSRAVIVCAAEIKNYQRIRENLKQDDFYIFCDGGLYHKEPLGVKADLRICSGNKRTLYRL